MKKIFIVFIFFILILSFYSCQDNQLKIGVIGPMETQTGQELWNAVMLSAEDVNNEGGILGRKIVLYPIDDKNKTDIGIQSLKDTIKKEKIDILVGGNASGIVLQQMEIMAQNKLLWLGTGGAHPKIIDKVRDNYEKYKYYFRVGITDSIQQALSISKFVTEVLTPKHPGKKFAIIGIDMEWARSSLETAKKDLISKGYSLTYEKYFPTNTTDFQTYFDNAVKSRADFIINTTLGAEANKYLRQYFDLKVPIPLAGTHTYSIRESFWNETQGKCVYNVFIKFSGANLPITPKTQVFYKKYLAKFNTTPGFMGWPGYDTLQILKEAAAKINSLEADKLIPFLENNEFEGNVNYKFTKDHDLTYGVINGKRYLIPIYYQWKKDGNPYVIWPKDLATAEFELPEWIEKR